MKHSRLLAATIVAIAGVVIVGRLAVAGASFLGQGTVPFDRIKVGRNDADKIELNGTILNSRKDKPVYVGDSLKVKGSVAIAGNLTFPNAEKGWISAPGADNVVGIDDDAQIMGDLAVFGSTQLTNLDVSGALTAGSSNIWEVIVKDAALTTRLANFADCVGTAAQYTTNVESSDYMFCFNTWLAGQSFTLLSNRDLTPLQKTQVEAEREFSEREKDGSHVARPEFHPLRPR